MDPTNPSTHETSTQCPNCTPTLTKQRGFKMTDYRYSTPPSGAAPSLTMHWESWVTWGSTEKSIGSDIGLTNKTESASDTLNWRPKFYTQSRSTSPPPTTSYEPAGPPESARNPSTTPSTCQHPSVDPVLLPPSYTILRCSQLAQDLMKGPVALRTTTKARSPSHAQTKASARGLTTASFAKYPKTTLTRNAKSTALGAAKTITRATFAKHPTSNVPATTA